MVELHLHLDGSFRPSTVWKMYQDQGLPLPADRLKDLEAFLCPSPGTYDDMASGLRRFQIPLAVMQTPKALTQIAYELTEDLARLGVRYAETRYAPQQHCRKGLTQDQATLAVEKGLREGMAKYPSIRMGLLLCLMRGGSYEANMETVDSLARLKDDVVCGLDIAGDEENYPASLYRDHFAKAKSLGLPFTMHAGEPSHKIDASNVWESVKLGALRIGHGTAIAKDEALMAELKAKGIVVECCLTSNVKSGIVHSYAEHPIRILFDHGVKVTLNSDNMVMAGTNIQKETELAKKYLGFTDKDIQQMEQWAYEARFLK